MGIETRLTEWVSVWEMSFGGLCRLCKVHLYRSIINMFLSDDDNVSIGHKHNNSFDFPCQPIFQYPVRIVTTYQEIKEFIRFFNLLKYWRTSNRIEGYLSIFLGVKYQSETNTFPTLNPSSLEIIVCDGQIGINSVTHPQDFRIFEKWNTDTIQCTIC